MNADTRPDPDLILETIKKREKKKRGGRLYLFLGMAPGVGKTYAMILAAHEAKKSGIDVVVGVVESHGRVETQNLVTSLEIIPKKNIEYRDISLPEMDLDTILKRKPKIILVDELAHTNVPGSRHAKRWQDVYEILDAGIDVFSTLNVQHLESRKETVEQIAGISVRETVPDSVLDRAYQIRLIDLSPQDLLRRLKEGKVYRGEKASHAADNFFKEDRLTALREISLRLMAEKVDYDLQSYAPERSAHDSWSISERLMVLVGTTSASEALIRATRKLAFNLEAPWIAAYIDTAGALNNEQQACVTKNLNLAQSLGAEIITLTDTDIPAALSRLAQQKNVTQLVVGRKPKALLDQLLKNCPLDIHVIAESFLAPPAFKLLVKEYLRPQSGFASYLKTCAFILSLSVVNKILVPFIGYEAVGFVFLLGTLLAGLFFSFGPMIMLAIVTALIWDIWFIPDIGKFKIQATQDFFMVITYFVAAVATGILTMRSQKHRNILASREARSQLLYEISHEIATNAAKESMIQNVSKKLGHFLKARCDLILTRKDGSLKTTINEKELAVALWVLNNQKPAGWSTDTLAGACALYLPLKSSGEKIGVLVFNPQNSTKISPADFDLLSTVAQLLGISLEREIFRERALETERLLDLDRMHRTLLNLISDEIQKPLAIILPGVQALAKSDENISPENRLEIADNLLDAIAYLKFTVDNLLTMSRLAVGIFPLQKNLISVKSLLVSAQESIARLLRNHRVEIKDHTMGLSVNVDAGLLKGAFANIFLNAAHNSPIDALIEAHIDHNTKTAIITINDQGSGLPEEELGRIFEKFYQVVGKNQQGLGLGLAVAKGLIKAHGGKINASCETGSGLSITVTLPLTNR
jgi:two-component system sensor histidine kinase KdpD